MSEEIYLATTGDLDKAKSKDINTEYKWEYAINKPSFAQSFKYEDVETHNATIANSQYFDNKDICTKKIAYGANAVIILNTNVENSYSDDDWIKQKSKAEIYDINTGDLTTIFFGGNPKTIVTDSEYLFAVLYSNENAYDDIDVDVSHPIMSIDMIDTSDINNIVRNTLVLDTNEIVTNLFYIGEFYYYSRIPTEMYVAIETDPITFEEISATFVESDSGECFIKKIEKKNNGEYQITDTQAIISPFYESGIRYTDYLNNIEYTFYYNGGYYYMEYPAKDSDTFKVSAIRIIEYDESGGDITIPQIVITSKTYNKYFDSDGNIINPINFRYFKNSCLYDQDDKLYLGDTIIFTCPDLEITGYNKKIVRLATDGKYTISCICMYELKLTSSDIICGTDNIMNNSQTYYLYTSTDCGYSWQSQTIFDTNSNTIMSLGSTTVPYVDVQYNYKQDDFLCMDICYYTATGLVDDNSGGSTITNRRYTTLNKINPNNEYSCKKAIDAIMKGKRLLVENYIVDKIVTLTGTKKSTTLLQFDLSAILSNPSEFNVNNFKLQFDTINITSGTNQPIITRSYDSSTGLLSITSSVSLFNSSCKATIWILKNIYN